MAGPFDVLAAQSVGFGGAILQLGLHGQGDLEGDGGDGGEQQFADGGVDALAADRLAGRRGVFDARSAGRYTRGQCPLRRV